MPARRENSDRALLGGPGRFLAAIAAAACIALAGCEEPENGPFEIRLDVMGMDGNVVRTAVFTSQTDRSPALAVSPDGTGIVAATATDTGFLDGNLTLRKHLRAEKTAEALFLPTLSPDGRQVAFLSSPNNSPSDGGVSFFDPLGRKIGGVATGSLVLPDPFSQFFAPDTVRSVDAKYKDLANHSLAVVIYHSMQIQYEYPAAREWVTRAIAARYGDKEVRDKIKGLRVIEPGVVLKYQDENLRWDEMDKTQLGKVLGADFVLLVSLTEFTTREPASIYQLQGRVTAEVSLYRTALPERESRVYKSDDIRVVNPKNTPGGVPGYDDTKIRQAMIKELAEKVVWKFYKHDEPAEE